MIDCFCIFLFGKPLAYLGRRCYNCGGYFTTDRYTWQRWLGQQGSVKSADGWTYSKRGTK